MSVIDLLELFTSMLGLITIAAAYEDAVSRTKEKKAGKPRAYPSLFTQITTNTFNLISSFAKKKDEPKPDVKP